MSLRNMAVTAALGMSLLLSSGCNTESAPVKKVASLDQTAIYEMDVFTKPEKELEEWAKKKSDEMAKEVEGKSDEEKAKKFQDFQALLAEKTNATRNPLKKKAEAAIASAAAAKGVTVVLDEKIVVYGVEDMTGDVKALLESGGELTLPEDATEKTKKAPVGYFNAEIVRNLKVFKEAEVEIFQERNRLLETMREELQKAEQSGKKPSPAEIQAMQKAIEARLESLQQQKMAPLMKAVTDSVEEVAKEEGLALVLDSQHVMYGGRNLTELVVDKFLKKAGGSASGSSDAAPAASPTPAGE